MFVNADGNRPDINLKVIAMIIDRLENLNKYASLHPLFAQVVSYLNETDIMNHETGRVKLKGDELFVNFDETNPKTCDEALLETHNRYIDIQLPLSGGEVMGYACRKDLEEAPYNEEKDITFYTARPDTYLHVKPGMFVIFFPEDAHAPAITPVTLRKIVVKILL